MSFKEHVESFNRQSCNTSNQPSKEKKLKKGKEEIGKDIDNMRRLKDISDKKQGEDIEQPIKTYDASLDNM